MGKKRRYHSASFKAKVALEAIKGEKTLSELVVHFSLHSNQIQQWKNILKGQKMYSVLQRRKNFESEVKDIHAKIINYINLRPACLFK